MEPSSASVAIAPDDEGEGHIESPSSSSPRHRLAGILDQPGGRIFVVVAALGLIVHVLVLFSSWAASDADESSSIILAFRASHGQFSSFLGGQNYGGTVLVPLEGLLVKLFGPSLTTFRIVDVVLTFVVVLLVRAVGIRAVGPLAGNVAAALSWVFPPVWIFWTAHEYLFWLTGLSFALGTAALCLRWRDLRDDRLLYAIGALLGLTFWTYQLFLCVAAPPVVALLVTQWRTPLRWVKALVLVPLGALPWLYSNLTHNFESLHYPQATALNIPLGVHLAMTEILPTALTIAPLAQSPIWGSHSAPHIVLLFVAALVFGGTFLYTAWFAWKRDLARVVLGSTILLWPFVVAAARVLEVLSSFRYAFAIIPSIVLVVADLLTRRRAGTVSLLLVGALSVGLIGHATNWFRPTPAWTPDEVALVSYLEANHLDHPYAGYWMSYPLTVLSGDTVHATSITVVRYPEDARAAASAPQTTIVALTGGLLDQQIQAWVSVHHDAERVVVPPGQYVVYRFDGRVDPLALGFTSGT